VTTLAEATAEIRSALNRRDSGERLAEEADRLAQDFRAFVYAAWPILGLRPLIAGWCTDALTAHVQAAYERAIRNLIVTIPPGYLKSTILSVLAPAWRWTHEPGERILSASHSDDLATRDTRRSRMVMQSEWYVARWGDMFDWSEDENLKTRYSNVQGGHRVRTHVGGGTGDRGTVLSLDDPHNAQEAHSEVMMQSAIDWWGETWASRMDAGGSKIVIGQRVNERDMIGHLLAHDEDGERWTHLCLPVRHERKHPYCYPRERVVGGRTLQGDPREEGELLSPDYEDEKALADRTAEMSQQTIAAQFQQRPAPREGLMLKRANWRYYDPALSFYNEREAFGPDQVTELASRVGAFDLICNSWDTSVKDREHSDYVAGGAWGCVGAKRYLLRIVHGRMGLNETIEAMLTLANWTQWLWPDIAIYQLIEDSANGPDAAAQIRSAVDGVTLGKAKGSKEVRADAASPALDGFNCYLPGYALPDGSTYDPRTPTDVQEFVEETAIFNNGQHDDLVDMWSSMVIWTRGRVGGIEMSVPSGQAQPPRFRTNGQHDTAYRPGLRT